MPVFRSDEWSKVTGSVDIAISDRENVDVWVSCTHPVSVFGVSGEEETSLAAGATFRFRNVVQGYEALRVTGSPGVAFGLKVTTRPRQLAEHNDQVKAPVIPVPEPTNLVWRMREMARQHHAARRMPLLEPEDMGFRSYELDDEEEAVFEEELFRSARSTPPPHPGDPEKSGSGTPGEAAEGASEPSATTPPPPTPARAAE